MSTATTPILDAIAADTRPVVAATLTAVPVATPRPKRDALKEIRTQAELASRLGFSLPQTIYAVGTELIQVGTDKARYLQRDVSEKPLATEALAQLRDRVVAERRRDVPVTADQLVIDPQTGRIKRRSNNGKPGLLLTDLALAQLVNLLPWAPDGAGAYLGSVGPEWRASEWSKIAGHAANAGYPLRLRTRKPDPAAEDVELYAVTSEKYTAVDPNTIADTVLAAIEGDPRLAGLRADIAYTGPKTRIHLIDHTDLQPKHTKVGDVLRATTTLRSADDKSGGINLWVSLLRVLCVNLTTGVARGLEMSLRHSGDRDALISKLREGIAGQLRAGAEIVHGSWAEASANRVDAMDVIAIVKRLCAAEEGARKAQAVVQVPGTPSGALLNYILEAYAVEPDPSQIGVVNAITRAPQIGSWADPETASEALASAGGAVLQMAPARFRSLAS